MEPKFNKGDYITNRTAGDLAIVNGITKKGYYTFKEYYSKMFDSLKDLKAYKYELQINYQKFWDLCTDDEKEKLDCLIKQQNEKSGEI